MKGNESKMKKGAEFSLVKESKGKVKGQQRESKRKVKESKGKVKGKQKESRGKVEESKGN